MRPTAMQRFASKVTIEPNGCWRWNASVNNKGYGCFARTYAHRFAYERFVGPIPAGLVLDHLCRNRRCANPAHLEPVTSAENCARGAKSGAPMKTHCVRGHAFTPENTRHYRTRRWTAQACVACRRIHQAAYRQRRASVSCDSQMRKV